MSASLQRLFKMAVGSYEGIIAGTAAEEEEELAKIVQTRPHGKAEGEDQVTSTLVTKTLGHHKDTPALAPFLGRAPKKRQIHVFDDDAPLDVVGIDNNGEISGQPWKMSYPQRSYISEGQGESASKEEEKAEGVSETVADLTSSLSAREGSRFHIPVRLIVTDYTLRLREGLADYCCY